MHTLLRQQHALVVKEVIILMCMVATHKPSLPGHYDTKEQGSRSVLAQVAVAQGAGRALRRNRRDACTAAYKSIMLHDEPLQNGPEQIRATIGSASLNTSLSTTRLNATQPCLTQILTGGECSALRSAAIKGEEVGLSHSKRFHVL